MHAEERPCSRPYSNTALGHATFEVLIAHFELTARSPIFFPEFAGNRVRGVLGAGLHKLLSADEYVRWFAPEQANGPSGLRNQPRPFVLRAWHLNGLHFQFGDRFAFDVHFFSAEHALRKAFIAAAEGLGRVDQVSLRSVSVPLDAVPGPLAKVRVDFLTPTELKAGEGLAEVPEFGILLPRLRDRISTLRAVYGEGALPVDFREIGSRAAAVRLVDWQGEWVRHQRQSSSTGQRHPLGGLVGSAVFEDVPPELLPFLDAGSYTGAGRQTTWGKGVIRRTIL